MDLALCLFETTQLNGLRRAKAKVLLKPFHRETIGMVSHQVNVFILEHDTDRYLGRLCDFDACPKGQA